MPLVIKYSQERSFSTKKASFFHHKEHLELSMLSPSSKLSITISFIVMECALVKYICNKWRNKKKRQSARGSGRSMRLKLQWAIIYSCLLFLNFKTEEIFSFKGGKVNNVPRMLTSHRVIFYNHIWWKQLGRKAYGERHFGCNHDIVNRLLLRSDPLINSLRP